MTEKNGHTLCFDGDCPFCRSMVDHWRGTLERRGFELVPLQTEWVRRRLDLPEEELLSELRVLTPDGRVLGGAAGLVHVWGKIWWAWPLWLLALVPGVKWLLDRAYRWVAERRMCLSGVCTLHAHPEPKRGLEALGWLPLIILPAVVVVFQNKFLVKWIFMWALAVAIFISCKWLTWVRALAAGGIGRTLFWVYGAFIVLTIFAFGMLSVLYIKELASGEGLARGVCAVIAIFWGVRLVVQLFVFDASEFLTTWYFKLGYHVLTVTFIYQTAAYGYCAFK